MLRKTRDIRLQMIASTPYGRGMLQQFRTQLQSPNNAFSSAVVMLHMHLILP